MKPKFGQKRTLALNPEELKHSWYVIERVNERKKREIDVDNGCYEPHEQILPRDWRGTHPPKSFWSKVGFYAMQLLP